jgi:8-oxo-dGTP diphosphatase
MSILLLRHATAGHRSGWKGADELRPLDKRGRHQTELLVESLAAYPVTRILTSPYVRCVQTVEPLAARLRLPVEPRVELGEGIQSAAVRALLAELREETPIVCTHGDVILDLIGWERVAKKGSTWILEPDGDGFAPAVYLPPPR